MTKVFAKGAFLGPLSAVFVVLACQVAFAQSFCADMFLDQAVVAGSRAAFQRVEGTSVSGTSKNSYDLMASPVTQGLWQKIAVLSLKNPNWLRLNSDVQTFSVQGDHLAVSDVAPSLIALWIRSLNELSQKGEPELARLFAGHRLGDRYRLPTAAELVGRGDNVLDANLLILTQDGVGNYVTVLNGKDARKGIYRYAKAPVSLRLVREVNPQAHLDF